MKIRGELDGAELHVQADIGFGDAVTPAPTTVTFPVLLDDMPAPVMRAYPKATVIAEKLEAIVHLGRVNSRVKDHFDIWILLTDVNADLSDVAPAVTATFARRNTQIPLSTSSGLSPDFAEDPRVVAQWRAFTTRNQLSAPEIGEVVSQLCEVVMPLFVKAHEGQV